MANVAIDCSVVPGVGAVVNCWFIKFELLVVILLTETMMPGSVTPSADDMASENPSVLLDAAAEELVAAVPVTV